MQTVPIEVLQAMDNPNGFSIVHPSDMPTLCKIIDAEGAQVHPNLFASRNKAEYQLYLMLLPYQKEEEEETPLPDFLQDDS